MTDRPPTIKNRILRPVLDLGPRQPWGALYERLLETKASGAPHMLALNQERFRGELEILAGQGAGVSVLPYDWQTRFLPYYSGRGIALWSWLDAQEGSQAFMMRSRYRAFLRKVLKELRARRAVDVVVGAAVHYLQDVDWGAAAHEIGVPYVVFHKENLVMSEGLRRESVAFYERLGSFEGDALVVHNDRMRSVFIDSGFATEDQVRVLGSARLDPFVRSIDPSDRSHTDEKLVVLFSFFHATGLMGMVRKLPGKFKGVWSVDGSEGFVDLFDQTHVAIGQYALAHPASKVVVKTKWGGEWFDRINRLQVRDDLLLGDIPNVSVTDQGDAQDLIRRARVVIGFGSTTLFEAILAGRRVVVPHFGEVTEARYEDFVPFADLDESVFARASSAGNLVEQIAAGVRDPHTPPEWVEPRARAFERYVAPLWPNSGARWCGLLRDLVPERS